MENVLALLVVLGITLAAIALAYGVLLLGAWIRDLRGVAPDTPDLRDLGTDHRNVRLWLRRFGRDPRDAANAIQVLFMLAAGLVALALLLWGATAVWGSLADAPSWALVMFVIVLFALFASRSR